MTKFLDTGIRIAGLLLMIVGVGFICFGEIVHGLADIGVGLFAWYLPRMSIQIKF